MVCIELSKLNFWFEVYHHGIKTIAVLKTEIFRFILVSACFLSLRGDRYGMVSGFLRSWMAEGYFPELFPAFFDFFIGNFIFFAG